MEDKYTFTYDPGMGPDLDSFVRVETHRYILENLEYEIKCLIEKESLKSLKYKIEIINNISENFLLQLKLLIPTLPLPPKTIKYPNGWWNAFKLNFFPEWLLKKFPVEYKEIILDCKLLYPNLKGIQLPNEKYFEYIQVKPVEIRKFNKDGVHKTHCCEVHGCKYGEKDCPVVNKKTSGIVCEDCGGNE